MTSDLDALERAYALVGGLAVSVRTEPRFTRDVDLAVVVDDAADAESVVSDLAYPITTSIERKESGRLSAVRLSPKELGRARTVDLLFASSGIEREVVHEAEDTEVVPGLVLPVATIGALLAMKTLSERDDRPQDRLDLTSLLRVASDDDIMDARRLLRLIHDRGFHRDKDLLGRLDELRKVG